MTTGKQYLRKYVSTFLLLLSTLVCSDGLAHDVHEHKPAYLVTNDGEEIRGLLQSFRETGDDRYLDQAWEQLHPEIGKTSANLSVLVDAATVAQSRHEFETARALVDRVLKRQPGLDQAWLLKASIALVQGRIDDAENACEHLRSVPAFVAMTCSARVDIARETPDVALRKLTAILNVIRPESANPGYLAWALSIAGDAAAAVQPDTAVQYYERSLAISESTQVRSALIDTLISLERFENALVKLQTNHEALPLSVRHFIVMKKLGISESVADEIAHADHEFQHWIAREDWVHAREMTRFYTDVIERPALAERLAKVNLSMQREPEDLLLAKRTGICMPCDM
ncbi:MAG: hypothetical protein AAF385_01835 [Pseudomonadota bacterium]